MELNARFLYGIGLFVLGAGNAVFSAGQLLEGEMSRLLALLVGIMGVTLLGIGGLIAVDSDRVAAPSLSDRALLAIAAVGTLVGLFLGLGGVGLLLTA
jgi:hypothetical protein